MKDISARSKEYEETIHKLCAISGDPKRKETETLDMKNNL